MKKILAGLLLGVAANLSATNYYVNPLRGSHAFKGLSIEKPFISLDQLKKVQIQPGDSILLSTEGLHLGMIALKDIQATAEKPVVITAYDKAKGERKLARLEMESSLAGVLIDDCSHVHVSRLVITGNGALPDQQTEEAKMRCGVLVRATHAGTQQHIHLEQLHISDIFYHPQGFKQDENEVRTANGTSAYGFGIRFISENPSGQLHHLSVKQCNITNVGHTGIKLSGKNHNIVDFEISHNVLTRTGGPGMQASGVKDGHIYNNHVTYSGSDDDTRKWGRGSGLWTWGSDNVLIEKNHFLYANGPADSAGCHIDFNCRNVIVQYCLSAYNAGGFCEILGNNWNCAYRYNISVNDGYRERKVHNAFQEGKTLWTSGFVGKDKRFGPCHCYIYNNTIYVDGKNTARIAFENTTNGLVVANNILYIVGNVKRVKGDQYNPEKADGNEARDILIKNNLFLTLDNWNKAMPYHDEKPLLGDPQFTYNGGISLTDYIPQNTALIKNKGLKLKPMKGDKIGLKGGMTPHVDILGNVITGNPDLGAIELK